MFLSLFRSPPLSCFLMSLLTAILLLQVLRLLLLLHDARTMRLYSFTFKWPQSPHPVFLYCYPAPDTAFLTSCVQH
ncbi:hypothetical protein BDP81DRAFT_433807 [Colletotrichum phormii]|uniref:Uncharacterized protein n=1 Tax=Colletotrichum phormii TaxID=359342 RepID=A0AAI9ZP14_9PEZI|nr:uncharacterized protein BDP81DRAFT_433807 [Colletotrichum phormii]KAK1634169.1 hypothetical protein BDP81DRAFT_433807 [Colletotrichum phormii]